MARAKKPLFKWSISETDVPAKGPYLIASLFAEEVVTEEATNVVTVKRVVDRVGLAPEVVKDVAKDALIALPMTMFIAFKTGGCNENRFLTICQTNPSGEFDALGRTAMKFDGHPTSSAYLICI